MSAYPLCQLEGDGGPLTRPTYHEISHAIRTCPPCDSYLIAVADGTREAVLIAKVMTHTGNNPCLRRVGRAPLRSKRYRPGAALL